MQAIFVDIANELREIEEEARMLRLATATHVALSGKTNFQSICSGSRYLVSRRV